MLGGRPAYEGPPRRGQKWHGTDRQVRGIIVQALRETTEPVRREALAPGRDEGQVDRCLAGLVEDGLVEPSAPGTTPSPGYEEAAGMSARDEPTEPLHPVDPTEPHAPARTPTPRDGAARHPTPTASAPVRERRSG